MRQRLYSTPAGSFMGARARYVPVKTGAVAAPFVGALDAVDSALGVCYCASKRLLASYAGTAATIRRASDNTTLDVPFASDGTPNVGTFLDATTGFFATLKDQKSVVDLTQGTSLSQPQWSGGKGIYDGAATELDASVTLGQLFSADHNELWFVISPTAGNDGLVHFPTDSVQSGSYCPFGDANIYLDFPAYPAGRISAAAPLGFTTGQHVVRFYHNATQHIIEVDGVILVNDVASGSIDPTVSGTMNLGFYAGQFFNGTIAAFLTFPNNLSDDDATIVRDVLTAL